MLLLFTVAVAIKLHCCCYHGLPLRRRTPHEDGSGWTYRKTCGCALCTGTKRFSRWEFGAENHLPRLPPPTPFPPPARNFYPKRLGGDLQTPGSLTSRIHPVRDHASRAGERGLIRSVCCHTGGANNNFATRTDGQFEIFVEIITSILPTTSLLISLMSDFLELSLITLLVFLGLGYGGEKQRN